MPVAAPMSFAGATQRTLNWLWHDKSSGVKFGVGLWAIPTILTGWWGLILGWYVFFGLLLAPYRLVRRGSRKRKREAAMHKQMLQAVNAGKPVATPTRQCPECAEEIRAEARKCKHCQSDVSGSSEVSDVPSSSVDQNSGRAVTEIKTDAEFGVESDGLTAAKKPYVPIWVWILVGFLAWFIVVGTSGSDSEESDGVNETSEPLSGGSTSSGSLDPKAGEPEPEAGEPDPCAEGKLGSIWVLEEADGCIDPWPLTSASGVLMCDPFEEDIDAVVWNPDEDPLEYYAINGIAIAQGYQDSDPLWRDSPEPSDGPKVNIGALLDAGLSLCGQ